MSKYKTICLPVAAVLLVLAASMAQAQGAGANKPDVFKGKLFAPNIILEHQDELNLTKEQFTAIRAAVVEVQASVAGHEWDMREAYIKMMSELDAENIDEDKVLEHVRSALLAENEVKQLQVSMLIKLRNLLTADQLRYMQDMRTDP
jgi:Spy/CpxP family protein refolding chaperone